MLAIVTGLDNDSEIIKAIVHQLIEQKIRFTGFRENRLLSAIPDDLEEFDALLVDTGILRGLPAGERKRLEEYASRKFVSPFSPDFTCGMVEACNFFETEITMFITAAGLQPEELPGQKDDVLLEGFLTRWKDFTKKISRYRVFNEYHLHFMISALALERSGKAPDGFSQEIQRAMAEMFRNRNIYGDHDQVAGWMLAPLYAERSGNHEAAAFMIEFFDLLLKKRPRTPEGLLGPGGFADDPLYFSGEHEIDFGRPSFTNVRRELVTNENFHFLGGAFAAATAYSGDRRYLEEAAAMLEHIEKYHRDPKTGLFFHASRRGKALGEKWGRGNSHAMLGAFYMLWGNPGLPEEVRGKVLLFLDRSGEALKRVQMESGLWHNVLDKEFTPEETSCSVLYTYMFAWLINRAYLAKEKYLPMVLKSMNGIRKKFWRGFGSGNCYGSWCAADHRDYYYRRPLHMYDMPLLAAVLTEAGRLEDSIANQSSVKKEQQICD